MSKMLTLALQNKMYTNLNMHFLILFILILFNSIYTINNTLSMLNL